MVTHSATYLLLFMACSVVMSGVLQCAEPEVCMVEPEVCAAELEARLARPKIHSFDGRKLGCDRTKVREIDFYTMPQKTAITVLEDDEGKKFIVKQNLKREMHHHVTVLRDKLGVFLANSVGILANSIEIIPTFYEFPGKRDSSLPATLHTFVPGDQVSNLPADLLEFKVLIKQKIKDCLCKKECGLTRKIIREMAKHKDLPLLTGFDTFAANGDRNTKNIFYDRKSDHYYAIDFGSCFWKNVALYACDNIQLMIEDESEKFTNKEMHAIKIYRDTIARLIDLYTPKEMHEQLITFAIEAGITPQVTRVDAACILASYKEIMVANYEACKRLVVLLNELITKHASRECDLNTEKTDVLFV